MPAHSHLPERIVKSHGQPAPFRRKPPPRQVIIEKVWMRSGQNGQSPLDGRSIIGASDDGDIVPPRHLQSPPPAHLGLGALARLAGVGGEEDVEPLIQRRAKREKVLLKRLEIIVRTWTAKAWN